MAAEETKVWPKAWPEAGELPPCPGLPLTDDLRERLREIRSKQMEAHRRGIPQLVCQVFYDEDVVSLKVAMGRAVYLGLDGRLHYENFGEGLSAVVLTDPRDVAANVVRFAGELGVPELIDRLPQMPEGAVICGICHGTRRMPVETMTSEDGEPIWCLRCHGLGWTLA